MVFLTMASQKWFRFFRSFNMTLAASGTLGTDSKVKYICTVVCGNSLRQFDLLSADTEGIKPLTVETIILGLDLYSPRE